MAKSIEKMVAEMDGLYRDVWEMVNMGKKKDRISFFKRWLKAMRGDE